jgi:hypothetical protein
MSPFLCDLFVYGCIARLGPINTLLAVWESKWKFLPLCAPRLLLKG